MEVSINEHKLQRLWVEITKLRQEGNYKKIQVLYHQALISGLISWDIFDDYVNPRNPLEVGLLLRFRNLLEEGGYTNLK